MTRDASLDEFLGGDDEAEDGARDETAVVDDDAAGDAADAEAEPDGDSGNAAGDDAEFHAPDGVEPARSTYDWSPEGAACAACGATVAARWRDEPGLVCADCKAW